MCTCMIEYLHCNDANILGVESSNPVILCAGIVGIIKDKQVVRGVNSYIPVHIHVNTG